MTMMATKNNFVRILFILASSIAYVACNGKYEILYAPDYMKYQPNGDAIDLAEIPSVIKSSFGFGTESDIKWNGLAQNDPFKRPKAQVIFSVESLSDLPASQISFDVNEDVLELNTGLVSHHLNDVMSDQSVVVDFSQDNSLTEAKFRHPLVFTNLPSSSQEVKAILSAHALSQTTALNITVKEDFKFMTEMYLITAIVKSITDHVDVAADSYPDFYHFKVDGYRAVLAKHGGDSQQAKECEQIMRDTINQVSEAMKKNYNNNAVVQVLHYDIDYDKIQLRQVRSLQATKATEQTDIEKLINVSQGFKENYAVTFNIILWTMVILIIVLLSISCGMWNMDPGHDSIIYRMTSQRLKRD